TASASRSASADLPLAVGPAISQMRGSMQIALTLVSPDAEAVSAAVPAVAAALAGVRARVKEPRPLGPGAIDLLVEGEDVARIRAVAETALADTPVDVCVQPWEGRRKHLLVADM